MRTFLLLFLCCLCFAASEGEGECWSAWNSVKSGGSRLRREVNPCNAKSALGSVCSSVNAVREEVTDWWWDTTYREKMVDMLLGGVFVGSIALLFWEAPVCGAGGVFFAIIVKRFSERV